MNSSPLRVLITRPVPSAGPDLLREAGVEIVQQSEERPIGRKEFLEALGSVQGAVVMLTEKVDAEAIRAVSEDFRCFANFAVGYDNLQVPQLSGAGIYATNTPGVLVDATADLAWALLLSAARRVVEGDRVSRSGEWAGWGPLQFLGKAVAAGTLGIIGSGRIGRAMARRALGFGMRVLYTRSTRGEPRPELEALFPPGHCRAADLDEILRESDFVSLHVPLTADTHHLISRERLGGMKRDAVLINTARGPVVDEEALIDALEEGRLGAAGLDVFEQEPRIPERLRSLENVVLLPHVGSATQQARGAMAEMAARNVLSALRGEVPPNCLNPEAR